MTKHATPSHTGHRARLQQRVSYAGADSLLDHEFLETLLTFSIPRKDTKAPAWDLLRRFGSLAGVLDATEVALCQTEGIGPRSARLLTLVRSSFKRYMRCTLPRKISLASPQKLLDYCTASLAGKEEEFLEAIFLTANHTLLETRVISVGETSQVKIDPRQILRHAISRNAACVILVHNHPSGHAIPSPEDMACTLNLAKGFWLCNVQLLDHIIITKGDYFSFNERNLLPKPKDNPISD